MESKTTLASHEALATGVSGTSSVTEKVRTQYELLPYPHREPERELDQLHWGHLDDLAAINHYCFKGQLDLSQPVRVLVAGGGTGDSTIQLGHQLEDFSAEIVHVDLSEKSLHIARERAKKRNLDSKISWKQGSLLDLSADEIGTFDYINCMGVLHHLEKPEEGLRVLKSLLKPSGAMGLMLYAKHGRTSIYQLQKMFELMGLKGKAPTREILAEVRTVLKKLPSSNWHTHGKKWFFDLEKIDDSELYDLFLHPCDQAFSVSEIVRLLSASGLNLLEFSSESRFFYQPEHAFGHSALWPEISEKPRHIQQELCEIYWGCVNKHAFWAASQPDRAVNCLSPQNIPVWGKLARTVQVRTSILDNVDPVWRMNLELKQGINVSLQIENHPVIKRFCALIDDTRTVGEIVTQIKQENQNFSDNSETEIATKIVQTIRSLAQFDLLFLRGTETVPFRVY